jgi:hypothetical protein
VKELHVVLLLLGKVLNALAAKPGCGFADPKSAFDAAVTAVFLANVMVKNDAFVRDVLQNAASSADTGDRTGALTLSLSEALLELMRVKFTKGQFSFCV